MEILIAGLLDPEHIVSQRAAQIYEERLDENQWSRVPAPRTRFSLSKITTAVERYQTNPLATITTDRGEFELELYFDTAPLTVMNFIDLAERDFYNDVIFHRVIANFVAQGGDPEGTGWGGPGYLIRCEYSPRPYLRGTVGIATSGKDTGGSQFFIALSPLPHLEGRYTVFGQVLSGMEVVDQIVIGDSIRDIRIHEGAYE
jgi:cyclophilin family peptidyl-prolyl cis-trans isomerase